MNRILVTGSRDWSDEYLIRLGLYEAWLALDEPEDVTLVHGAARGADSMASVVAANWGWFNEPHYPNWQQHGKRAGHIRNEAMVDSIVDICVAFLVPCKEPSCKRRSDVHYSHGTWGCRAYAIECGVRVIDIEASMGYSG